ncbi:MAG TPA: hypothetical protein VGO11_07575, partial [Chthoniobacteraceae bacterium]|nr:hypothetical protein [Chthoniobacteraceae bacterium]
MPQLRVLLGFANAPDHSLEETTEAVIAGLYGNPEWPDPPTPPVSKVQLQGALADFRAAIAAQAQGGTAATAHKNNMREVLIALLRKNAGYVQEHCDNNLAKLLSSGFEAVSNNRAQNPLEAPTIKDIRNGNS